MSFQPPSKRKSEEPLGGALKRSKHVAIPNLKRKAELELPRPTKRFRRQPPDLSYHFPAGFNEIYEYFVHASAECNARAAAASIIAAAETPNQLAAAPAAVNATDGAANYAMDETADKATDKKEAVNNAFNPYASPARSYRSSKRSREEPAEASAYLKSPSNHQDSTNRPEIKRARPGNILSAPTAVPASPAPPSSCDDNTLMVPMAVPASTEPPMQQISHLSEQLETIYEGEEETEEENDNPCFVVKSGHDDISSSEFADGDEEESQASTGQPFTDGDVQDLPCMSDNRNGNDESGYQNDSDGLGFDDEPIAASASPSRPPACLSNLPSQPQSESERIHDQPTNNSLDSENRSNERQTGIPKKKRMLKELESSLDGIKWVCNTGTGRMVTRSQSKALVPAGSG